MVLTASKYLFSYKAATELLELSSESYEAKNQKLLELTAKKYRLLSLCHHSSGCLEPKKGMIAVHKAIIYATQSGSASEDLSQLFQLLARFKQQWIMQVEERRTKMAKKRTGRTSKSKIRDEDEDVPPSLLSSLQEASIPNDKIAELLFEEITASRGRGDLDHLLSVASDILAVLPADIYPYRHSRSASQS